MRYAESMTRDLVLHLDDLRRACNRLIDAAESQLGSDVALDADTYWNVDLRSALELTEIPAEAIDAGSLVDDLGELSALLARPGDELVLWHDLGHVCGLLRYLAFRDLP
jgi:hypothetical protein